MRQEMKPEANPAQAFGAALEVIGRVAPTVASAIRAELRDQRESMKLIASENYASPAVLLAMGNWLNDKYAEGVPGRRFYAGCDHVDDIESHAIGLAKALFNAEHAYVQPHSGADANLIALWAILTQRIEVPELERLGTRDASDLSPDDWEVIRAKLSQQKLMGMALDAGGHLTHGYRANVSGKMFRHVGYGVDSATGLLDYTQIRQRALDERPLIIIAGFSSYPRNINFRKFREIAEEVDAVLMVDMAHFAGLVAGGVLSGDEDPVPFADVITSTTHKTLRGPRGGLILSTKEFAAGIDKGCPLVMGGPLPHVIAAKAVALEEAAAPGFKAYARDVVANARSLAGALEAGGMTITTGGTDNHMVLIDLSRTNLTGRQAESALRDVGITVNRNVIPRDPAGPWYTSGLRLGTPALTTRGMGVHEMEMIASFVATLIRATSPSGTSKASYSIDDSVRVKVERDVQDVLGRFPLYPGVEL